MNKMEKYYFATGRRKSSIVQARLMRGKGKILTVSGDEITDKLLVEEVQKPLELVSKKDEYDITIKSNGGGFSSLRGAARLAVARALAKIDPEFEKTLKKEDFLTRDPREKERKKPGLKRARRAPQWAKR